VQRSISGALYNKENYLPFTLLRKVIINAISKIFIILIYVFFTKIAAKFFDKWYSTVRIPISDLKNNPFGVILKNSGEKIPFFFSVYSIYVVIRFKKKFCKPTLMLY
jgi:hypothetical protein